jgi:cysteine desulfuration protein SufE
MNALNITEHQLVEQFAQQPTWQDRYRQLIALSKRLPPLAVEDKNAHYHINGCENNVWLKVTRHHDGRFHLSADSDGRIVKGLLAILVILVDGKTAEQITQIPFSDIFHQLKIDTELSESRLVGLNKLIEEIRQAVAQQNS